MDCDVEGFWGYGFSVGVQSAPVNSQRPPSHIEASFLLRDTTWMRVQTIIPKGGGD